MNTLQRFFKSLGPGFISGIADDDPSGISTYSQTGILFGFQQLWLTLFTVPFMIAIQEMCGRIGMVTGKGITALIKSNYPRPVLFGVISLLVIANIFNIGADIGAMAAGASLVLPLNFGVWVILLTVFTLTVLIYTPYPTYVKFLKYLSLTVLSYVAVALIIHQEWLAIFKATFIPEILFTKEYLINIIAVLGTTISPYLFFWQADEEVEEKKERHEKSFLLRGIPALRSKELKAMRNDTVIGMFLSNLIAFFVITTTASTLHNAGGANTLSNAAEIAKALTPLAGEYASLLFALGIIGTGLLAIPVLAGSAAYAISEAFEWNMGLGKTFAEAKAFYGVIIIATLLGVLVNFTSLDPMQVLYYAAILNAVLAPPILIMILFIANNKKILGNYTNGLISNILGWIIALIMTGLSIAFFVSII